MAILQISQITNRKGLQADLPQLAGAELGWSIDERRLWIGNGTIAEGAPVVGNTEILTEYSNIAAILNYTYSGLAATTAAGVPYTAANTQPVLYQDWFDQYASVLDWGIKGDGSTDIGNTLNAALYQMYCVEPNAPSAQRALFFPAGVYYTEVPILIPSNATLIGEGPENTIIQYGGTAPDFVARTADNNQQVGNSATSCDNINISNMGFENLGSGDVFQVENTSNSTFNKVAFTGPQTELTIPSTTDVSSAVRFNITPSYDIKQVVFNECTFLGTVWGVNTDVNMIGVTFNNSEFNTLQQGIVLGSNVLTTQGPSGTCITNCLFDNIYNEGIIVGTSAYPDATSLTTTGHNIFLDVGDQFNPGTPTTPIIIFSSNNNLSIGDMFSRTDADALIQPRISILGQDIIATQTGSALSLGHYTRKSSRVTDLLDDTIAPAILFTQDVTGIQAFSFNYTAFRNTGASQIVRTGTFTIASNSTGVVNTSDDYTENSASGITFTASRSGNIVTVRYTTTSLGPTFDGLMQYSINYFN